MGFARNGVIVDEPIADILRDIVEALRAISNDLSTIERRIWKLENER